MKCAECKDKKCYEGKDCTGMRNKVEKHYEDEINRKIMEVSTEIEATFYMKATRVEETILFARNMGFTKIGLAFCIGFSPEAEIFSAMLKKEGLKVFSVCCKVCGIDKKKYNLKHIKENRVEAICDPTGQAEVLKKKGTDMNIIMGLCVGHDMLFTKYSHTLVTTLIAKDRVLAHNPAGAIYSPYYRRKLDRD